MIYLVTAYATVYDEFQKKTVNIECKSFNFNGLIVARGGHDPPTSGL